MAISIAEISETHLRHNLKMIQQRIGNASVLAMVKADSYGHGMLEIAKLYRQEKVKYLGVALITEALQLRQNGDNGKILVMVSPEPNDADLFIDFNIETAFSSFEILQAFEKRAREREEKICGHLYIDTGMHRDGVSPEDAVAFMDYIKNKPNIEIVGLMTHLATADMPEINFAAQQIERFEKVRQNLESSGYTFKHIHCANSCGILNYPNAHYTMVRPGIALYGYMPNAAMARQFNLKPALTWKSKIMLIKNVQKGDFIGYSKTYVASHDMTIAVVPAGYADGLPRNLSNRFQCLIGGKRCQSVGSVCMDEFMVDITNHDVNIGDEVVIMGKQGEEEVSVYELAELSYSIPYERTSAIGNRIKRVMVE